jgi:hypothetical protein
MAFHDEHYALDKDGNRVLIGLSVEETQEFEYLDELISIINPTPAFSSDDRRYPKERRWLFLYEKHLSAMRLYLRTSPTRH